MKSLLPLLLLSAACPSEPGPDLPVEPGTNGSAATNGQDEVDNGPRLRGRVCVVADVFANQCANTGAGGLAVSLGDQTTTTNEDGSFAMTPTAGTGLSFLISGADVVTTSQALSASMRIPVLRQAVFDRMMTENGITTTAGTGSIFASLVRGGEPVQGVSALSTPSPAFGPFFDGTAPTPWTLNATGARGIVWFPGVQAGPADLSFNTGTGGEAIVGGVQVINGGITMVETILP
jgi:hypothetical protein